jgi:hypothetical protein
MPRTQKQIRVPGVGVDQVRSFCLAWLTNNGLEVVDQTADGSEKKYPVWGQHLTLHPTPGSLVAVNGKLSGAVVFELLFYPAGPDTVLYVQGYAAGAGPMAHGKEYEFSTSAIGVGGAPRKRGNGLLQKLEADLAQATARPYGQYPPAQGQPVGPYPPPTGQPVSPYTPGLPVIPYYPAPTPQPAPAVSAAPSQPVGAYYPPPGRPTVQPVPGPTPPAAPYYLPPAQPAAQPAPMPQRPIPAPAPVAPAPVPVAPPAPTIPPAPTVPLCGSCGRPTTFIPQYGRYYCYPCSRYV